MSNNIAKIGKIRSLAYTTATSLHNSIIEFEARKEALASLLKI